MVRFVIEVSDKLHQTVLDAISTIGKKAKMRIPLSVQVLADRPIEAPPQRFDGLQIQQAEGPLDLGSGTIDNRAAAQARYQAMPMAGDVATAHEIAEGRRVVASRVSQRAAGSNGSRAQVIYHVTRQGANAKVNGVPGVVLAWLKRHGPATNAEIEQGLDMGNKATQSAVWALKNQGLAVSKEL